MTTEFADFVASQDARNEIELNITKHCWTLCDKLQENYIEYSKKLINKCAAIDGSEISPYHQAKLERLERGESDYEFVLDSSGRKYHKIWEVIKDTPGRLGGESRSCHAFINKKTGEVFKPASYKAPAKIARFNLLLIESREACFNNCDWAGAYLYIR
tara:strand:+ start:704 stop:1177 length:474 start_codon:yes stop_codon:yes gene_type:complete